MKSQGVQIIIDLGEAIDRLTILLLKVKENKKIEPQVQTLINSIKKTIGVEKYLKVISSAEHADLARCNRELWRIMEKAKEDKELAGEIDAMNFTRFKCKQKIQQKFTNKKLEEVKIR